MGFPEGASTITLIGRFPVPVGGTARAGRIVLAPSTVLVDRTQHAIYSGGGSIDLAAEDGTFSVELLCDDDPDILPAGWRWHVDEQPAQGVRRSYWIALPSTLGATVSLDEVAEISAPGGGSQTPAPSGTPSGPAGGALTGTYPNPALAAETLALFDQAGAANTAQAAAATDATTKASAAQSAAATDATAKVAAHAGATDPHGDRAAASTALALHVSAADPHGDRAWADSKFATTNALGTLNSTVTDLDGFVQDCLTRVAAVENGTAWLAGLNVAGNAQVASGDLTVADTTKGYRFRRGGSALDLEATGADLIVSNWSGTGFNGTQNAYDRYASNALAAQHAGLREYVTALYGAAVHAIDPTTGVAALGARNGLSNVRLCGRRATTGAPTTGDWAAGDSVLDSAGTWWLCTASGTPGTWTTPPAAPTAHASAHGSGGTDPVTVAQSQVTGLAAALAALLPLAGGTMTGTVTNNVATSTTPAFGGGVTGDPFDRWRILANGGFEVGPGSAARDTNWRRSAANEWTTDDAVIVSLMLRHLGTTLGFYGATAVTKPAVTGSRGGNAALASLLTALASLGLITDSTTA